jgi:membrane protein
LQSGGLLSQKGSTDHSRPVEHDFGAIIAFMFWMWLSTTVILMGAELDAEMEHQTVRDTTTGDPKPLGARGATMADTVGAAKD